MYYPILFAFCSASLQEALTAIAKPFTGETGVVVRFSFASSAVLARQIEQGAPADIFASADIDWMDWARARNLIKPETRVDLLGNNLVVVAPSDAKFSALSLERNALLSAIGQSRLATGEVKSVPAGLYAKAALEKLGLWNDIQPRLAQTENVRAALALVARGEAPLGIVYETDGKAEPRVKVVATFPAGTHPPIVYPFALTAEAKGDGPARFLSFLQTDSARAVFTSQGFAVLPRASDVQKDAAGHRLKSSHSLPARSNALSRGPKARALAGSRSRLGGEGSSGSKGVRGANE